MEKTSVLIIGHRVEDSMFLMDEVTLNDFQVEIATDSQSFPKNYLDKFQVFVVYYPFSISDIPQDKIVIVLNSPEKTHKKNIYHFEVNLHGDQLSALLKLVVDLKNEATVENQFLSDQTSFLESALDAVIGMNSSGNIIYWNKQAEIISGWTREEVLGKRMSEVIIPEEYRTLHENGLRRFLKSGEGPILGKHIEIVALRKSGEVYPVELTVTPIKSNDDYIFSAFLRDISERKKIESEKKEEKEKLSRALHSRDDFISICSHELKTPVTSMKLQFQIAEKLLKDHNPIVYSKPIVEKRIYLAIKQLNRMQKLIEDMLDVTRISKGKIEYNMSEVNFELLVREVLERFEEQLNVFNIDVHFDVQSGNCIVIGDVHRLDQAITNLISNAIKYGEGSPIQITLMKLSDGHISFSVKDAGIGIEKEKQRDIFKQYERAVEHTNISGLGLGLYISSKIVEAHHGQIKIDSEKDKGATFTIELPSA